MLRSSKTEAIRKIYFTRKSTLPAATIDDEKSDSDEDLSDNSDNQIQDGQLDDNSEGSDSSESVDDTPLPLVQRIAGRGFGRGRGEALPGRGRGVLALVAQGDTPGKNKNIITK